MPGRKRAPAVAALIIAVAVIAGCGGQAASPEGGPRAKLEHVGHGKALSVVLTPTGARRIGIQTATVTAAKAGGAQAASVPYSALLYEPDGRTAVYVRTATLAFTRYYVSVDSISGDQVYVSSGLTPGMTVVVTGAEELLGVQNGVGVET
jgi:hypothetical protein